MNQRKKVKNNQIKYIKIPVLLSTIGFLVLSVVASYETDALQISTGPKEYSPKPFTKMCIRSCGCSFSPANKAFLQTRPTSQSPSLWQTSCCKQLCSSQTASAGSRNRSKKFCGSVAEDPSETFAAFVFVSGAARAPLGPDSGPDR